MDSQVVSALLRKNMCDNVIPVLVMLKNLMELKRSPFLRELRKCLSISLHQARNAGAGTVPLVAGHAGARRHEAREAVRRADPGAQAGAAVPAGAAVATVVACVPRGLRVRAHRLLHRVGPT